MKKLIALLLLACCAAAASADNHEGTEEKIREAMKSELRGEADTDRDRNRRPVETLMFFGLRDDMKVVELMPGGGWYTKILAPVLEENGEYYAALGTSRIKDQLSGKPGFEKMNFVAEDARIYRPEGERFYAIEADGLGVTGADMVLTFRNYHNFSADGRAALNDMVFDALEPGGIYGIVDHSRRHMEPDNPENGRRVDPVLVIKEVEDAGFEFVDYSTLHYRPDDELRYEVGRATVTGNTDRFTFKFRKP